MNNSIPVAAIKNFTAELTVEFLDELKTADEHGAKRPSIATDCGKLFISERLCIFVSDVLDKSTHTFPALCEVQAETIGQSLVVTGLKFINVPA